MNRLEAKELTMEALLQHHLVSRAVLKTKLQMFAFNPRSAKTLRCIARTVSSLVNALGPHSVRTKGPVDYFDASYDKNDPNKVRLTCRANTPAWADEVMKKFL